ncbi:peptidoglycan DD-metalloendopeptidase family protein [Aestuariispira ectoiniformans]|uniref:peptidoglycan DD-metalloendopeptidase family protein n=1 Tax=Aestuariispira ectoiniformans TaxID=2775080 RepID=UPI0028833A59|nr:peptidoglycan DD-metalloendopeptidase family protein [Aestuariispira ectoiniformans]
MTSAEYPQPINIAEGAQNRSMKARLRHLFRERELLVRSEGKVTFIRLSSRLQMGVAAIAAAGVLWGAGATVGAVWKNYQLQARYQEIAEARQAYDQVLRQLASYQQKLEGLSGKLAKHASSVASVEGEKATAFSTDMQAFLSTGRELELTLNQAAIDIDVPEELESKALITPRRMLHAEIKQLEGNLEDANRQIRSLSTRIQAMDATIAAQHAEVAELSDSRKELEQRVVALTDALSRSKDNGARLISELDQLKGRIRQASRERSQLNHEKSGLEADLVAAKSKLSDMLSRQEEAEERLYALNRKIVNAVPVKATYTPSDDEDALARIDQLEQFGNGLIVSLEKTRAEADAANDAIKKVLAGLNRVAGYVPQTQKTRKSPPERALALLQEIESLHDTQLHLVERLNENTDVNITQAEATLADAGLDVDRMLNLAGANSGQGGPLVTDEFADGNATDLAMNVAVLEAKIDRWTALQGLLSCVPLIPPLQYYHVTSSFGPRKDPFTGRRAVHEGMDMGAVPGMKVRATAPGVVTKAGRVSGYGRLVEIDHGCGIKTRYGHLKKILVKKGQKVDHRAVIGKVGSTGRSTGPHVHYEVRIGDKPVNPATFIEAGRDVFKG